MLLSAEVDLAVAVRRYLAGQSSVVAAVGPGGSSSSGNAWIFVETLQLQVEGSGQAAVTVVVDGPWAGPNRHNTAQFPRLLVEVFADPTRNSLGDIAAQDARARAWSVWRVLDKFLHRTDAFVENWGASLEDLGTRVWGSQLLGHPDVSLISDWDGGRRLSVNYGLSVG